MPALVLSTLLVAAGACADVSSVGSSGPTFTDSAGVRIVGYDGMPEPVRTVALSEEPLFRHGHRDGDYPFQAIVQGALDGDGRAVVFDRGSQELVRVSTDGAIDTVLARSGQGPEEVTQVISVVPLDDRVILVQDRANGKIMRLEEGRLPESHSTMTVPEIGRRMRLVGIDDGGSPLLITSAFNTGFEEPWLQGHMARLDLAAMEADTVATYDLARRRPRSGPTNPFGHFGRAAVSGPSFVSARSDIPELTWRDPDGTVRQILRWAPEPRYPDEADWREFTEGFTENMRRINPQMSQDEARQFAERQLERFELRTDEPYPLFADLRGDDQGRVWMGVFHHGGMMGVPAYDLIASDGTWLGRLELPSGFRVLDVRDRRVLGVLPDELEVESVAVYELVMEPRDTAEP
ncbi:MAG: hypothetical protein U5R14_12785 [Gemmatimonadota bacterium]|nr:hypothetical protein [Gemmatimonadota bacterium]